MRSALVVFGRAPEFGKVKSRLAKSIGEKAALAVYSRLLKNTLSASRETGKALFLFGEGEWERDADVLKGWTCLPQQGEGLGERMLFCFEFLSAQGFNSIVLIGTDIDQMNSQLLNSAFSQLENSDVVIGRASDGGYYLIGMKEPHPELFRNMVWSREDVFDETVSRSKRKGLTLSEVAEMHDIDTIEDLRTSSIYPWFQHNFANTD